MPGPVSHREGASFQAGSPWPVFTAGHPQLMPISGQNYQRNLRTSFQQGHGILRASNVTGWRMTRVPIRKLT